MRQQKTNRGLSRQMAGMTGGTTKNPNSCSGFLILWRLYNPPGIALVASNRAFCTLTIDKKSGCKGVLRSFSIARGDYRNASDFLGAFFYAPAENESRFRNYLFPPKFLVPLPS
jgi:hypothetical protein